MHYYRNSELPPASRERVLVPQLLAQMNGLDLAVGISRIVCSGLLLPNLQFHFLEVFLPFPFVSHGEGGQVGWTIKRAVRLTGHLTERFPHFFHSKHSAASPALRHQSGNFRVIRPLPAASYGEPMEAQSWKRSITSFFVANDRFKVTLSLLKKNTIKKGAPCKGSS